MGAGDTRDREPDPEPSAHRRIYRDHVTERSLADIAGLLRLRDGIYADDLVLAALIRLDLLTVIAQRPGTLDDLCRHNGLAHRPADVLCTLLRAIGLLEPGDILRPTPLARACIVQGSPYDIRPYLASAASRADCVEQVELLRTGQPAPWTGGRAGQWPHDPAFGEQLPPASTARCQLFAPALADLLTELIIDRTMTSVLDLSGTGAPAKALAARHPDVAVSALDAGAALNRLPDGHDLHVLSHVLHCWDERTVRRIIGHCFDALVPGGWIVNHDTHLNRDKSGPLSVARYSALLLHATEGRCWSTTEVTSFLADAGFVAFGVRPCGLDRTAVLARKPDHTDLTSAK